MGSYENVQMKTCPFCAEEIKVEAIKCKHCGSMLEEFAPAQPVSTVDNDNIAYVMLIIPIVAALLMWFWVGSMNLFQNPGSALGLLSIGTIILTAILGAYEASKLGMKRGRAGGGMLDMGPVAYFFALLLLWIIGFPAYLYHRSKYGRANLLLGSLFAIACFIGVYALMGSAIDAQVGRLRDVLR